MALADSSITAQLLINRAMRLLGLLSSGEIPTAQESSDCLEALNAMLDSWRNDRLMIHTLTDVQGTLTATTNPVTIGTSGAFNTDNPNEVVGVYFILNNVTYNLDRLSEEEYAQISLKSQTSDIPKYFMFKRLPQLSNLYTWPAQSSSLTAYIQVWYPLPNFSAVSTTAYLMPGYRDAIVSNLALTIAPEFKVQPDEFVIAMARSSKAGIKKVNSRPIRMQTDLPLLVENYGGYNVRTDS